MNCEDKKPADDDRGLRCWKCGGQRFWVVYTRHARAARSSGAGSARVANSGSRRGSGPLEHEQFLAAIAVNSRSQYTPLAIET